MDLPPQMQAQLQRSLAILLTGIGYSSAGPGALESLMGLVDSLMLAFLRDVRISMLSCRRAQPNAVDFTVALSRLPLTRHSSNLSPQLDVRFSDFALHPNYQMWAADGQEFVSAQAEADEAAKTALLQNLMVDKFDYIPSGFPPLPPKHAWMATPVFPPREHDRVKMREHAAVEGDLAEQALKKLTAVSRRGERMGKEQLRGFGGSFEEALMAVDKASDADTREDVRADCERFHWRHSATVGAGG
ncbi:hypothetical protein K470DRAFT_260766 [Piedraia hortae CBS 480.64]|uniref:Transcription initiation factor TFIID subunit 8 n=1 Tax=Piedraia hortae CBS 480.64 TaxID=1314780 RepID=A0A6A7BQA3_9PEZI|nr:hypothetical protein K470DRAFT_260766 [Piedraia hortae CBS 480.64]